MDKQMSTIAPPTNFIPVNTRTIGTPEGIYILYLEDYVHTFIKKILAETDSQSISLGTDPEYRIDPSGHPPVALYGRSVEENGRYRLVVSGAALLSKEKGKDKIRQIKETYFPSGTYIGTAYASWNKDARLRLELVLNNMKVVLDDFYIYYDQNEEMQNYLIEWNAGKEKRKDRIVVTSDEAGPRIRDHDDDAVRLSRIAQAYGREEAKVSFMWNVMNILCLGFVVCVMAYGIVSINNYNKMQDMQESIDYCMAFVAEHTSFDLREVQRPEMSETTEAAEIFRTEAVQQEQDAGAQESLAEGTGQPEESGAGQTSEQEEPDPEVPAAPDTAALQESQPQEEQAVSAEPMQYYIVRRGDTLRSICFDIYGDYSKVDAVILLNGLDDPNNILYGQKLLLP